MFLKRRLSKNNNNNKKYQSDPSDEENQIEYSGNENEDYLNDV